MNLCKNSIREIKIKKESAMDQKLDERIEQLEEELGQEVNGQVEQVEEVIEQESEKPVVDISDWKKAQQPESAALQQELDGIAAEIGSSINSIRNKRKKLFDKELRGVYQAALTSNGNGNGNGKVNAEEAFARVMVALEVITEQVRDSYVGVRTKLEAIVERELLNAVETALD